VTKRVSRHRENDPEHDPWFNPYRFPRTERAWELVHAVLDDYEAKEKRVRARAAKDQHWLREILPALVCDLSYDHLRGCPGTGLVVVRAKRELGKKSRYYPPLFTRSFPKLLNGLERLHHLQQRKGSYSHIPGQSKRTTIRAGSALIALIEKHQISFEDFALSDAEEVIILKRAKTGHWDEGERIEYDDTPTSIRFRKQLLAINAWLAQADLEFRSATYDKPVDARERRLFRYFANANFESGGRLFRGFWENLPKRVRLEGILIEGEPIIELDYAQLNPTLAYAEVGCTPPAGDAYTLPGFEMNRESVKQVFNALLFDKGPRKRFPRELKVPFPRKVSVKTVIDSIRAKHPKLVPVLSSGAGFHLMFAESEIMMAVLETLRDQGIVGLPIFDAVIVKRSKAEAAKAVMKSQFKEATKLDIQVRVESV
jgi:hypothetical protein